MTPNLKAVSQDLMSDATKNGTPNKKSLKPMALAEKTVAPVSQQFFNDTSLKHDPSGTIIGFSNQSEMKK